jgi:type IV pilus assembly protein PilE
MGDEMIKKQKGFTLIELLVTVLIVGILGTIAYSTYSKSVLKGNRSDAKTSLMQVMQTEERYFSEQNTYTTNLTTLGFSANPLTTSNGYYQVSATASASGLTSGITLTAAPVGNQTKDVCGSYILNSLGQKSTSSNVSGCW